MGSAISCGPGASRCGPEDVGLVGGTRRRVAGLRREELALLAGISSDYYLRLEQGRDTNPSAQVLDALARVLQLDVKATEYLHQLANPPRPARPAGVDADGVDELIDLFPLPTIVVNRCLDVLAANPLARALSPGFAPGQNFLRWRLFGACRPRAVCGLGRRDRHRGQWASGSGGQ